MKVYVNDISLEIFEGATVKDALNKYFAAVLKRGIKHFDPPADATVCDHYGNRVMTDGSLSEDDRIYIDAG